jgi:phosphoribosyl-dephospho-CoA transferase
MRRAQSVICLPGSGIQGPDVLAPRPHDLLRLSTVRALPSDAPPWAACALSVTPWVVVRRAAAPMGRVAVGVRGTTRSERYATEVDPDDVCEVVAPEDLSHVVPMAGRVLAAACTLHTVRPLLDDTGLPWGPTGSVGFELATAVPTATSKSDLDLLVRVVRGSSEALPRLAALHRELRSLVVRVDCQIETSTGAVALAELVGEQSDIMVRTADGPRLVPRAIAVS